MKVSGLKSSNLSNMKSMFVNSSQELSFHVSANSTDLMWINRGSARGRRASAKGWLLPFEPVAITTGERISEGAESIKLLPIRKYVSLFRTLYLPEATLFRFSGGCFPHRIEGVCQFGSLAVCLFA